MRAAGLIGEKSRILYVDDGSKDRTWELVSQFNRENPWVEGVKLSHNRGHQHALLCGLMSAMPRCDAAISMDADLAGRYRRPDQFVKKFQEGCDVVYGVRNKRDTDTWFKRTTAEGFYKVMKSLGADVVFNHADYRLLSRPGPGGSGPSLRRKICSSGVWFLWWATGIPASTTPGPSGWPARATIP